MSGTRANAATDPDGAMLIVCRSVKKLHYVRQRTETAGALRVSCIVGSLPAITRAVF